MNRNVNSSVPIFFFLFLPGVLFCSSAHAQDFYKNFCSLRQPCEADTSGKISYCAGEPLQHYDLFWCAANEEISYENLPVPDSVQQLFAQLVKTSMGEEVLKHIALKSVSSFNDLQKGGMDSSIIEAYPHCGKIRFKYNCVIQFNDSLIFPLEILTNTSGKILNPEDLPKNLKEKKSFQLLSPCEIFSLAASDHYIKKEGLWNSSIELHYSNRLQLFYYEIQAHSDEEPLFTSDYMIYKNKYIFLDAVTGKILWRTIGTIYAGHQECPKPYGVFPKNSLQD